jgi:hypothetical protein
VIDLTVGRGFDRLSSDLFHPGKKGGGTYTFFAMGLCIGEGILRLSEKS